MLLAVGRPRSRRTPHGPHLLMVGAVTVVVILAVVSTFGSR